MTEAEIHAYALAETAAVIRSLGEVGLQTSSDGSAWQLGTLRFWKSSAPIPNVFFSPGSPLPMYRRGGLYFSLFPDMRLEKEPFTLKDGRQAFAVVLRSDNDAEGIFGTYVLDEREAIRIIELVTDEMNAARRVALKRFQSTGGDPAVVDSLRAPTRAELSAQLDALLGNPDEQ